MHFVHVEDFFHPDAGYQINLLTRLQVKEGHQVTIVTGELDKMPIFLTSFFGKDDIESRDKVFELNNGVKIFRHPLYKYYSGRAIFKPGLHQLIKKQKPDVLFVHCEDTVTGMKLLWDYKTMKIPYVLDCHMLEMASENRFREYFRLFYRTFVTPVILKNNIPLIRVVDSDFVQKHYAIPLNKTHLLSFGTDTDLFKPNLEARNVLRKELGIGLDDFIFLYAGKLDASKGGLFFATSIKDKIQLSGRSAVFIVIGTPPDDEYGLSVENVLGQSENRITRLPTQPYSGLPKFYQTADVAVYPKQCSMSYFEAQSCGLPVVLEENEINIERVSAQKGLLFKEQDASSFRAALVQLGNMGHQEFGVYQTNARENILQRFDFVPIAKQFSEIMINEYNKFHNV